YYETCSCVYLDSPDITPWPIPPLQPNASYALCWHPYSTQDAHDSTYTHIRALASGTGFRTTCLRRNQNSNATSRPKRTFSPTFPSLKQTSFEPYKARSF